MMELGEFTEINNIIPWTNQVAYVCCLIGLILYALMDDSQKNDDDDSDSGGSGGLMQPVS